MRHFFTLGILGVLAACAPEPVVPPAPAAEVKPGGCELASDADFQGEGEARLRNYLAWLAHAHGAPNGVQPEGVSLAIVRGATKPGPAGIQAGEIGCASDGQAYRITLYRDALAGRPLATTYHTLAHEFHHVVQIRRGGLPCGAGSGPRAPYEREAEEVAARLAPLCRK